MRKDSNTIIYNSDLIIRNGSEMATLCVFYDKVMLPHTTPQTCDLLAGPRCYEVTQPKGYNQVADEQFIEDVATFSRHYYPLILEKVIERLPPPPWGDKPPYSKWKEINLREIIKQLATTQRTAQRSISFSTRPLAEDEEVVDDLANGTFKEDLIKRDLVLHFLRPDLDLPQLFVCQERRPPRELLKAVEARAVFDYLLPALGPLKADQILEVRERVKDLREGFSMHLQKLSKGVEGAVKSGEPIVEIEYWAKSVIETELIPDYREFRRQLASQRSGFWNKVLDAGSKIFQIQAAPWTPKFYYEFLKAMGVTLLTASAEHKESLSNRSQAYHFMMRVEDSDLLKVDED